MKLFHRSANQPVHPADWSQAPRSTKRLALAVIVLVAAVVVVFQQSGRAYKIQGPSGIARNAAGSTLLNGYEKLFLVDAQQHLTKLTAMDLGLGGPISSITAQGDEWILGDDSDGLLHRCDAALHACRPLFPSRRERLFSRAHGITPFDGKWIISDSERHRLRVYDSSGRELLNTRTQPIELCFPNEITAVDGVLYVADTNNFRIARVDMETWTSSTFIQTAAGPAVARANCADLSSRIAKRGDAYGNLMLDTVNTVGRPTLTVARHGRVFPASLLHASSGDWWLVQMKGLMTHGDVILYSPERVARLRVSLPDDSDPTSLLETADGVLVTDPTLARIYDVDREGHVRDDWGPADLKAEWQQILQTRERWKALEPFGWLLLAVAIVCGLIVIVRELLRTKGNWNPKLRSLSVPEVAPLPLQAAEEWIGLQPTYARTLRRAVWWSLGSIVLLLVAGGGLLYSGDWDDMSQHRQLFVTGVIAVVAALLAWIVHRSPALQRMRIGTNGTQLLFDSGNGVLRAWDFSEVLASQQTLLAGSDFIRVYTQKGRHMFPPEQLQRLILARIPRGNFVGPVKLYYTGLKRGSVSAWSSLIAVLVIVIIQLGSVCAPQWSQSFSQFLAGWLRH